MFDHGAVDNTGRKRSAQRVARLKERVFNWRTGGAGFLKLIRRREPRNASADDRCSHRLFLNTQPN
jgi:hypothetical protein